MTATSPPTQARKAPEVAPDTLRITVAVPTYRRPADLRAALPLLLEHVREVSGRSGGRYAADILVVDNDADGTAAAVVTEVGAPEIRHVVEPTPGIAAARNRAMDEAAAGGARLLSFIDDDERPMASWLSSLVDTWERTGAAAVKGRVVAEFDGELDPWVRAGDFWFRRRMPTGTEIDVAAAGNLLLDLDQVRRYGVRFDTALGLAGGEDTLFSRTLARRGGRMVFCDESAALDFVPRERMTRAWVLARARSHGNAAVLTELRLSRPAARPVVRARWAGHGLLRVVGGGTQWCCGVLRGSLRQRVRGVRAVCRGAGMIGGACGLTFVEYARDGRHWRRWNGGNR
jgi:hypothetical protein